MLYCSPYSNTPIPSATLDSLLDVVITSPTQGQALLYNATTSKWENSSSVGTVTTVSVVAANGISGTVANATTSPAITLTLGAITPTSVAATGTITGSNLSGTNTGDQTITLTNDVTGSGTGSITATISNQAVTYSKIQNVSSNNKLLGRATTGSGSVEEISLGSGLIFSGTSLALENPTYPQVNTYNDLPITLGTPPIGSIYVVLTSSGVWLINRKEAGLYRRTGNTGALTDWERLGNWSDIAKDSNFQLVNSTNNTKLGKFDLSSISPNNLRTLSFPDASGTIALLNSQAAFSNIIETFKTTSISYAVLITDKTIEVITPNVTITLLDTVLVNQRFEIINASGGNITIVSSTTKQIGNLPSGNPTIWTQQANSTYTFVWTGTLWRIL